MVSSEIFLELLSDSEFFSRPNLGDTHELSDIKGRLLTPEEGCGYSKVANTRIIGGTEAKIGNH